MKSSVEDFIQPLKQALIVFCSKVFFAFFLFQKKEGGGPKWTRTTDLTIISRVL